MPPITPMGLPPVQCDDFPVAIPLTRPDSEGLATVDEAARWLRIGKTWLYGEMEAGRLAYCKFGRARRIPWTEIRGLAARAFIGGRA